MNMPATATDLTDALGRVGLASFDASAVAGGQPKAPAGTREDQLDPHALAQMVTSGEIRLISPADYDVLRRAAAMGVMAASMLGPLAQLSLTATGELKVDLMDGLEDALTRAEAALGPIDEE